MPVILKLEDFGLDLNFEAVKVNFVNLIYTCTTFNDSICPYCYDFIIHVVILKI